MTVTSLSVVSLEGVHPKYRRDIDGLRALAVLSVVWFHAFPGTLSGGFVGVDVFFVISGYLISTIIFGSLARGGFSFATFYQRRVRRIFPSLLVVLAVSLAVGWGVLLASEYQQLGLHTVAGATFLSNLILWGESGYFDTAAGTKPLLHLWSLGIEEQFYIFWPLILWLSWKLKFRLLSVTSTIALISFVLNLTTFQAHPVADFYSPQTRFWELLCGAILADLHVTPHRVIGRIRILWTNWVEWFSSHGWRYDFDGLIRGGAGGVGLTMVAAGMMLITPKSYFPGFLALLPVLGTCLVIAAGPRAWFNRHILSNRVAVWFGAISFPLYLWHWPLLSFPQIIYSEVPPSKLRIAAVVVAVLLAWLTYRFVERPMRFGSYAFAKTTGLAIMMVTVALCGLDVYERHGLGFRTGASPSVRLQGDTGQLDFHKYMAANFFPCTPNVIRDQALHYEGILRCFKSKQSDSIDIALVGDSHAEALFVGLAERLRDKNIVYYIKASAPFLSNHEFDQIFATVLSSPTIKTVIITSYWAGRTQSAPPGSTLAREVSASADRLIDAGKTVYITNDVPNFPFEPERCKYARVLSPSRDCSWTDYNGVFKTFFPSLIEVVASDNRIKLLDTNRYFCSSGVCNMVQSGKLMYRDNNHLNLLGTRYLADALVSDNPDLAK